MKLIDALRELDPFEDHSWTKDGQPAMAELERLMGDRKVTREEVEAITGGAKRPVPGAPVPDFYRQPIPSPGRIVMVTLPNDNGTWPAIVVEVEADHAIGLHAFLPMQGGSVFYTGVKHKHQLEALPDGDAGRNVAYWEWPKRS